MSADMIVVSGCEYANPGALLEEKNTKLLSAFAMYADTAPDVLKILSNHSSYEVRQAVSQNPVAPAEVLDYLANDSDCVYYVAKNPNTDSQTLSRIIMQPSTKNGPLLNALSNPNTPFQVIMRYLFSQAASNTVLAIEANPKYGDFNKAISEFDEQATIDRIESRQF